MKTFFIWAVTGTFLFAAEAHKTGNFKAIFKENSPHSEMSKMIKILPFARKDVKKYEKENKKKISKGHTYKIKNESYSVYVPKNYKASNSYGLFVFISASDSGRIPPWYKAAMDKHRIIWVGANKSGNMEFEMGRRIPLVLDAVWNMKKLYNIDTSRVYLIGVASGSVVASRMAPSYPDIFNGAFYIIGVNYWEKVDVPEEKGQYWPGFGKTKNSIYKKFNKSSRIVFCTGIGDMNREQMKIVYELYKEEKFQVSILDIPNLGQNIPKAIWLEKGLKFLDAPFYKSARVTYRKGVMALKKKKYSLAMQHFSNAERFGVDEATKKIKSINKKLAAEKVISDELAVAKKYYELDQHLSRVIKTYGKTAVFSIELQGKLRTNKVTKNEILAWKKYYKYRKGLKKKTTKKSALKKLASIIKDHPDTKAAERTEKLLDKFRKKK
ncbi:MAG: hypothetical protein HRT89_06840 [Lentisphaeria bacterium]|nr:hypothetical protein [Lentisphaeria bacterium]NQZ67770.1 hypothetical protein [Lentisphaeria bacterium]